MQRITGILAIILVLVLALSFIGCSEKKAEPEEEVTPPVSAKLEILSHKRTTGAELGKVGEGGTTAPEWIRIVGTAKNVSGDTLSYAEVKASFFDEKGIIESDPRFGTPRSSFNTTTINLAPGGIWEFEIERVPIPDSLVHRYEIEIGGCY